VGNGVVIDPVIFKKEIDKLKEMNVDVNKTLRISRKAHLIIPTHRILDAASEAAKGKEKIGSTLKGIGPAYMDKTGRNGLRVGDIFESNFQEKYNALVEKHKRILSNQDFDYNLEDLQSDWFEGVELLKSLNVIDSEHFVNGEMKAGKSVLAEGAQGPLLDIDFGSYPFVTSSNTTAAGACTGLGVAPNNIGEVIGIFKAYCTRVGSGPFPTELHDEVGDKIRKQGGEFGATTGRPRRCGWIDLPALKYAIMVNGATQLNMTKADVLSEFTSIKVCTHYKYKGEKIDYMPYDISPELLEPIYEELPGWKEDLTGMKSYDELPKELTSYVEYLEKELETPITIVSVGPDRTQTIERQNVMA
jgi:adenylosuccinate synthase